MVETLVASLPEETIVISGGCRGVDSWAAEAARSRGMKVIEYLPDLPLNLSSHWEFTRAYHARNRQIAENSDVIYAFVAPDRKGGTENTIKHAKKLGIRVEVISESG
jgi:predicted Rossmann-fold nucleotide-binding protein